MPEEEQGNGADEPESIDGWKEVSTKASVFAGVSFVSSFAAMVLCVFADRRHSPNVAGLLLLLFLILANGFAIAARRAGLPLRTWITITILALFPIVWMVLWFIGPRSVTPSF
jgi:hypothetical protein